MPFRLPTEDEVEEALESYLRRRLVKVGAD
jgi:hypothetical protein